MPTGAGDDRVFESTANGFNHFHTMWQRAVEGAEDEDRRLLGAAVLRLAGQPGNALQFASDRARERFERTVGDEDGGGDPEEVELVEAFGVTLEQLFWRRSKVNGPEGGGTSSGSIRSTRRPRSRRSSGPAARVPGHPRRPAIREARRPRRPVEGVLRGATGGSAGRAPARSASRSARLGAEGRAGAGRHPGLGVERLLVWEHPLNEARRPGWRLDKRKPDGQYVVFVDVAVGQGGTAEEGDWHAVQVLDHVTRRQVARYRSRIPVHDLPLLLYLIGLYFNEAWLAPEINGPGHRRDRRAQRRTSPIYRRHRSGDDQRNDAKSYLLGWQTTSEQVRWSRRSGGRHGLRDVPTAREFDVRAGPEAATSHGAQPGSRRDSGAHRSRRSSGRGTRRSGTAGRRATT
jgi:hypothetical protein